MATAFWSFSLVDILSGVIAICAFVVAIRANRHSKDANATASEANSLSARANEHSEEANQLSAQAIAKAEEASIQASMPAERSIRVSKLPEVAPLYREFREFLPRLREPDQLDKELVVRLLHDLEPRIRLVSLDTIYPPFHRATSLITRLWQDSRRRLSARGQEENKRFREDLTQALNDTCKAFEDFINR